MVFLESATMELTNPGAVPRVSARNPGSIWPLAKRAVRRRSTRTGLRRFIRWTHFKKDPGQPGRHGRLRGSLRRAARPPALVASLGARAAALRCVLPDERETEATSRHRNDHAYPKPRLSPPY